MKETNPPHGEPRCTLYQFAFSHFNEKARWALDFKGLPYAPVNLLPGFHTRIARKRTGSTQTPFLVVNEKSVAGSAAILERLEQIQPTPALFPSDPRLRADVEEWIVWLDEKVGPAVRLGLFDELLDEPGHAAQIFAAGQRPWKRQGYRLMFPKMIPMLRAKMSITRDTAIQANDLTAAALDRIETALGSRNYLVGDSFTAADLTAASLLFPLCFPKELPFALPSTPSAAMGRWQERWASHSTVRWTQDLFRKHRGTPRSAA